MLDPDEKDKDGMPLTARCVSISASSAKHRFAFVSFIGCLNTLFPSPFVGCKISSLSVSISSLGVWSGVYHRPRQKAETVAALSGHHGTQLWWDPEGGGFAPAHSRETSGHTCRLEGTVRLISTAGSKGKKNRVTGLLLRVIALFLPTAWRLCDGLPEHVWGGGCCFVPRRRLHQRPALWQEVPALHTTAMNTDFCHTHSQLPTEGLSALTP